MELASELFVGAGWLSRFIHYTFCNNAGLQRHPNVSDEHNSKLIIVIIFIFIRGIAIKFLNAHISMFTSIHRHVNTMQTIKKIARTFNMNNHHLHERIIYYLNTRETPFICCAIDLLFGLLWTTACNVAEDMINNQPINHIQIRFLTNHSF